MSMLFEVEEKRKNQSEEEEEEEDLISLKERADPRDRKYETPS